MAKYTITIEGDFEKGECYSCPLSLIEYELFRDDEPHCMAGEESSNCPLEEATVAKNATVEEVKQGEWIVQVANKPKIRALYWQDLTHIDDEFACAACGASICYVTESNIKETYKYCNGCGQAIDWSEE